MAFPLNAEGAAELRELHAALIANEGDWSRTWVSDADSPGVTRMPHVEEHPLVTRTRRFLADHDLTLVFDWTTWTEGSEVFRSQQPGKYREVDADFVRKLLTALIRSDRFNEGVWVGAFRSGDVQQLLGRLLELQHTATAAG